MSGEIIYGKGPPTGPGGLGPIIFRSFYIESTLRSAGEPSRSIISRVPYIDPETQRGGTPSPYINPGRNYIDGSGKYIGQSVAYMAREAPRRSAGHDYIKFRLDHINNTGPSPGHSALYIGRRQNYGGTPPPPDPGSHRYITRHAFYSHAPRACRTG